jgi:tetratricopeptide (TPR) repeat protein
MKFTLFTLTAVALLAAGAVAAEAPANGGDTEMTPEKDFPESRWPELRTLMETKGAAAVVELINGFDESQRLSLFAFAQQAFGGRDWAGKNFDAYIELANAGIAEALRQAEAEPDAEKSAKLVDRANVMSYNLSADLAECWPGDTLPRAKRHFEAGLKAAEDCIRWREELGKGPFPFALAYWARGMHQFSLGDVAGATASFKEASDYSRKNAEDEGVSADVSPEGDFGVILNAGYLGLAEWAAGDEDGRTRYDAAIAAFREGAANYPDKKDDFLFGIDQLEWVKAKFVK